MLVLRPWTDELLENYENFYQSIQQDYCLIQVPVPMPSTMAQAYKQALLEGKNENKQIYARAIFNDDTLIGKIELLTEDHQIGELDIVLKEPYTRKQYGRQALQLFLEEVIQKKYCHTITAYVRKENQAIIHVLEACGFSRGRNFQANITESNGSDYKLKEVEGIEYTKTLFQQA